MRAGLIELGSVVATLSCVREVVYPIEAQAQLIKLQVERLSAMEPIPTSLVAAQASGGFTTVWGPFRTL